MVNTTNVESKSMRDIIHLTNLIHYREKSLEHMCQRVCIILKRYDIIKPEEEIPMTVNTATLLIVFVFTFIPLIIAEVARKQSLPTVEDFFIQSRKMPTVMVFFTVYATWVSSFAFMGATSYFYERGPVYLTCFAWNALFAIMFYFVCEKIWYYGKKNGYVSPVDFFSDIYGSKILNLIISLIMIVFTIPYLQIQLAGGAYIIETATDGMIPWKISGLIFYLIIIIYLWAGGLRAVAMADIYYGILLFSSMLFVGFYLAHKAGGVSYIFEYLSKEDPGMLILSGPNGGGGPGLWLSMFIVVPVGAIMGPQIWIRSYATHKRAAFKLLPFILCLSTIEYVGPILSGVSARVLGTKITNTDMIIPTLLLEHAPKVLCAVLFCGIAAAALSTANSQIHATAAIYTVDFHKKYINPDASDKQLVSVGKWSVLAVSAFAYLLLIQTPSVIVETGTLALGGTAQVLVPTLGALFWKKSNPTAALLGLIVGETILCATFFTDINANYLAVMGLMGNGIVFLILSIFLPQNANVSKKITEYKEDFRKNRNKDI